MHFCDSAHVRSVLQGKRVAIVGSGPGALDNEPGFIDSHDVVVRVNNHGIGGSLGQRTDVHYSFYGGSIKVKREDLIAQGCKLVMCKCPDAKFIESEWHKRNNKPLGTDFRYIYRNRKDWWFCPTYVPTRDEFMASFDLLEQHVPSTGFSAILAVMAHGADAIYLTGFDFFASRIHNVSEPWRPGNPDDPIGHSPERERDYVRGLGVAMDKRLTAIMEPACAVLDQ
jgi:hypothetical protein